MSDVFDGSFLKHSFFHHVHLKAAHAHAHAQNEQEEAVARSDHWLQALLPDWDDIYSLRKIFGWWLCGGFTKMGKKRQNRPKNVFFFPLGQKISTLSVHKEENYFRSGKGTCLNPNKPLNCLLLLLRMTMPATFSQVNNMYYYGKSPTITVRHQPS